MKPRVVVMGVAGSGKTTIGEQLARVLEVAFVDGDSLHPLANVEKMAAGLPLDDEDRRPWLAAVAEVLANHERSGVVVACSALKRLYRTSLLANGSNVFFIHLTAEVEVLRQRLSDRSGHFMTASMLDSQLRDLEPLGPGEPGVTVNSGEPIEAVVVGAVAAIDGFQSRP